MIVPGGQRVRRVRLNRSNMYGALEDVFFHQKIIPMALHERKTKEMDKNVFQDIFLRIRTKIGCMENLHWRASPRALGALHHFLGS